MAQTHFFLLLDKVSQKMKKELNDRGNAVPISFVSQRCEMACRFMELKQQPFYFLSRPEEELKCYRKVTLHAYLLSYKMFSCEKEEYFLVFGCNIDKVFEESYASRMPAVCNQSFWQRICTLYDLLYLQKAMRGKHGESLFYPLYDAKQEDYRDWIDDCVKEVADCNFSKQALQRYIPEYAAIDVRTVFVEQNQCHSMGALTAEFNKAFFNNDKENFHSHWANGDDTLFALCLLKGNENMHNVSSHQVEKYRSHAFTNNRHEMMYVGRSGIVFLRTHHPFLKLDKDNPERQESMPDNLAGVQNVYELCAALSMKKRIEQQGRRLKESPDANVRSVLARLAQLLNARLTNVVDFDNKYRFIYGQMHVLQDFENLKQTSELLSDAYQLKLSQRISRIALLFTISAFVVAFLQIIQNHINSNNDIMNFSIHCFCFGLGCRANSSSYDSSYVSSADDSVVMLCAYILAAFIIIILLSRYVFYPFIKDIHKHLHRDMEDNL